ncbi:hypothetical protein [Parasitella parasitica]|uniref:Tetratricopeptide repeat protein 39B n=1 Tax=Parasitella parasitica TaxID=35722 RepID=A0A0B7N2K1_9FUNG|nr:hypothetical protein [Parasitella parasitica]
MKAVVEKQEPKIEDITNILQDEFHLTFQSDREIQKKKFIPHTPTEEEINKIKAKDPERFGANLIQIKKRQIAVNQLTPREQEKEVSATDESVIRGLNHLFDNQFMAAKAIFEEKADCDPLNALALSSMAFLKAVMTSADQDQTMALNALNETYNIANTHLEAAKKSTKISGYFSGYYNYLKKKDAITATADVAAASRPLAKYPSNSVLRAHVLKAECCLQIAILQLLQESVMGYVKCGLNLRRGNMDRSKTGLQMIKRTLLPISAYSSYSYVWSEYQKMGADYLAFIDSDTISGVQFGIGSVHLVLSALPAKILKAISAFGWQPNQKYGFALLNECRQSKRVRSSMATIMLLAYYTAVISYAPQIMIEAYKKTAMDILLDAQKYHPNSAVFLLFAGRIARNGLDLPLSTQSFLYAAEISRGEWAEVAVTNSCRFEMAVNHILTGNWSHAAATFEYLYEQQYWSAAFCRYAQGACYEMMGSRTEAILLFAEVPQLVIKKLGGRLSDIDSYVLRKVTMFQKSGYQNLDFYAPILEFMCIWNLFPYISPELLTQALNRIQRGLAAIQECENREQEQRMMELAPNDPMPDYFDERASLLVAKASILNVLGRSEDTTLDINWILDHKECISQDSWTVPYALWEAGVSCWSLDLKSKSRQVWEMALDHGKHDFEHRLAIRLNLALAHAEELGFTESKVDAVDNNIVLDIKSTGD